MSRGWDIVEIKKQIAHFHERGTVSNDVVKLIIDNGLAAPVECEIFDYKQTQEETPAAAAKLVRHIVSFYNSFGGYLLFGVTETESEIKFEVTGVKENLLDLESIKARVREFVGERIQISGSSIKILINDDYKYVFLLFIPKRPENGRPPIHFHKDAPGQIFRKDDVYHRVGDECIEAKGPKLFSLTLPRQNPYLTQKGHWNFEPFITNRIENNLPDRNFICPKFIGRDVYLDALWRWLGDDLSRVKMLAGEGGLGKTSIAYEFAERVSRIHGVPFEQVIWLTAKRKQFVGSHDDYITVPETHYSTYNELIRAIIKRLPILLSDDELHEMPIDDLKRQVRDGLSAYPSFLVIDDIDSLDAEQQRLVVELGFVLGSCKSKLLLTTRHNLAYSHDLAIQIAGFEEPELSDYLQSLKDRSILTRDLVTKEREKLRVVTEGSPLYTESICRLLRFQSFEDAIRGWGLDAGVRVRAAALEREISMLTPEARRVLFSAALLSEVSVPELAEVTEYPQEVVLRGIQVLSSLFLLAGEALGDQPRFSVPSNTARLIAERPEALVVDYRKLENRATQLRTGTKAGKGKDNRVGLAISQAQSLLRLGDVQGALDTIDDAKRRIKRPADLLGFRAEVLIKFNPARYDDARKDARDAYRSGCRRPTTFFAWFESEWALEHFIGAVECAQAAIDNSVTGNSEWWVKLAAALVSKAESQRTGVAFDKLIDTFFEASAALSHAIQSGRGQEAKEWEGVQYDVHDRVWGLALKNLDNLDGIDIAVDALERIWKLGDFRFSNANHALAVGKAICTYLESPLLRKSESVIGATRIRLDRCNSLIKLREDKYRDDTRHPTLNDNLSRLFERFDIATSS